jgi:hypothetical protein
MVVVHRHWEQIWQLRQMRSNSNFSFYSGQSIILTFAPFYGWSHLFSWNVVVGLVSLMQEVVCRKFDHSRDELTLGSVQWKCTSTESLMNFYSGCQLALLFWAELADFCNICFPWDAHFCMDFSVDFGQNNSRACNLFYACQAFWGDRQTITGVSTGTLLTELFRF